MKSAVSIALLSALIAAAPAAAAFAQDNIAPATLTRAELAASLQSRFEAMDLSGDGFLDRSEIEAANAEVAAAAAAALSRRLEEEFARLDANQDGMISLTEFKAGVPMPKPSPVEKTLAELDSDQDQKISFEEFSASYFAAFDQLEADEDGTLNASEQQPAGR